MKHSGKQIWTQRRAWPGLALEGLGPWQVLGGEEDDQSHVGAPSRHWHNQGPGWTEGGDEAPTITHCSTASPPHLELRPRD